MPWSLAWLKTYKHEIAERLKRNPNAKLNKREIAYIEALTGVKVNDRRVNRSDRAKIIKLFSGETVTVKHCGNNGNPRQKQRDIALVEAFAIWDGTRESFLNEKTEVEPIIKKVRKIPDRTVERALVRGEQYLVEQIKEYREQIEKMKRELAFRSFVARFGQNKVSP